MKREKNRVFNMSKVNKKKTRGGCVSILLRIISCPE